MNLLEDRPLVLAIAPVSRGFGFAVSRPFGSRLTGGGKEVRREKNAVCLARTVKLLEGYAPAVLVLDDWADRHSRRTFRVRSLLRLIAAEAEAGAYASFGTRTQTCGGCSLPLALARKTKLLAPSRA